MFKLDTRHKKKSFVITTILHLCILFLLFFIGLGAADPEEASGIAVNFGTTPTGSGKVQPTEKIKTAPKQQVTETPPPAEETPELTEELVTQDAEDAPVVEEKPKKKPKPKTKKPKKTPKKQSEATKTAKKPDPKPDKSTLDILNSFSKGPKNDGKVEGGEGDDANASGDKGNPEGNPYANSYYGQPGKGGLGNGVGYGLNGRGKATGSAIKQECNEAGRVVVKIIVNRQGRVIQAIPGVKGTTNSASCLLAPAKKTALTFKWKPDPKAPAKQIGFIEITFSLGE